MASLNKVILLGNLTRDPELRYAPNGTPVARFGLAVNTHAPDKATSARKRSALWILLPSVVEAETASEYLE